MKKPLAIAIGTTFVTAMSASPIVNADSNPFGMQNLGGGYMQVADSGMREGKCGEGKMKKEMEGKCGESHKKEMEGKCGEGKMKKEMEGKCGEGKCGEGKMKKEMEGKCGEGKMKKEGKCGEGKCGGNK